MSLRYKAGINLPGYDPIKVPNAPIIGTATAGNNGCVSVTFTAPSCVGGGTITSYTAYANCGIKFASGAASPLTVTGLSIGSSYTFNVVANNAYGPSYPSAFSNSVVPPLVGSQSYTTPGTYTWVAPTGVTSVSVVTVGAGAGGKVFNQYCQYWYPGGGGGALAYRNSVSVTPGNSYTVVVGAGGIGACNATAGGASSALSAVAGGGSISTNSGQNAAGGSPSGTYTAGYSGGYGKMGCGTCGNTGGGGGAAGYSGNGGNGGSNLGAPTSGSGGGGGGGRNSYGGGVGIFGQGSNGSAGAAKNAAGGAGSGGSGQSYGGGAGYYGSGAGGAVRILWPGTTRQFPSTNVDTP